MRENENDDRDRDERTGPARPAASPPSVEPDSAEDGGAPYRNLWVPLFVVPALVVIVLLAVFVFFGAIAGSEASIGDNLDRVRHGGSNARSQAIFNLGRQVAENQQALLAGDPPPWPVEEGVLDKARGTLEDLDEDEGKYRCVLAHLLYQLGDDRGLEVLVELLSLSDEADPDGRLRFDVMSGLAPLGDPRSVPALLGLLEHPDAGLRASAAIAMQRIHADVAGGPVREALRAALSDEDFVVRANAAVALSHLGDAAAGELLWELTGDEAYELERRENRKRFRRAEDVVQFRVLAVRALARLGRPEDRPELDRLSQAQDVPILVREAAMQAVRSYGSAAGD